MHIEVSTDNNIDGSEALATVIKGLVQQELAHLDEHISRIEVHLSDPSTGTTGHEEKHCMLEARLKGQQPTVVKHADLTLEQATKGAASKMKSSLERTLGKLSDRH
ncbi:HPF/RaiA family ribosome-associated protein [Roseovarius arcticus]|uniref:HPF/RaiA family ribosome-associated protein n=1 Tax=Roseovarius arcticus TaxID=2547404 RepID=UPI00111035A8|nr:HPF/RaiA family ribosome-associated protein [Roseovarius arcticus]